MLNMIYHVFANRSNVGDWLSAKGIQSLLGPLPVCELLCDTPFVPDTIATLNQAVSDDFIIIGGGGLFMDYFVPFWEAFRPIAKKVPFVIWGVGCCDLKRNFSRPPHRLISEIVRQSQLCSVRDELTRTYLSDCDLPAPVGCPALLTVPRRNGQTRQLLHVDNFDAVGPEVYQQMVEISQSYARETERTYRQTNNLIPAGHNGALARTLDLYVAADLVLTSRLHGCVLALATGRQVLAVAADRKIDSFMGALGLSEWICPPSAVQSLPETLAALSQQSLPMELIEAEREQNRKLGSQIRAMLPAQPSFSSAP